MNTTPFFSIITVTYNAEELLQKTIDSIRRQTFPEIEYIIVDGASKDNTLNVISQNKDVVTSWVSESDSGIYDAMNKGISISSGKWINFMNAGDIFCEDTTLESVAKAIQPDTEVAYGHRYYLRRGERIFQEAKDISTIYERMPFGHQSTFARSDVLKENKFNSTYKFAADYDLLMRLYLSDRSFQKINVAICDFLAGGQSESGLRPYLETIKILLDHTKDPETIKNNIYFKTFRSINNKLMDEICGK